MIPEMKMCQICNRAKWVHKVSSCDPHLRPEEFDYGGQLTPVLDFKQKNYIYCRHFTCVEKGLYGAILAWKSGMFSEYIVAGGQAVWAVAFGSIEKHTEDGKRIVTREGLIYSFQDGVYYYTGLKIPSARMERLRNNIDIFNAC